MSFVEVKSVNSNLPNLTLLQIFNAGLVHGMLTSSEKEFYAKLGKNEVTQRIVEKQVLEDFAKKSPKVAEEYRETMRLLFGK